MSEPTPSLEELLPAHIQTLATTLRPGSVRYYYTVSRRFLSYLNTAFPQLHSLSQLRRDPHLLGWFRSLVEQDPPLCNHTRGTYLIVLRRLFRDLADNGHSLQPELIRREDFPPPSRYLPRALSPEDDQRLQQQLRSIDNLHANALLLTRATGIRIGECINLSLDCLRSIGDGQWALHVPLGKLHSDRLVPVDDQVRQIVARLLVLRALAPTSWLTKSEGFLLPRRGGYYSLYLTLNRALAQAAQQAHCSQHVTPHQLRHSYATEMLRLGVSLPALMKLLGHTDIRMTLRYLQVTQQDLQREFHLARQSVAQLHHLPLLTLPHQALRTSADLPSIQRTIAAARHLLEMYRRQLTDKHTLRKLQRLDKRLLNVASELELIN
jgi:site-specific recombinase XerD